jgi:carbonic anhydrase
MTLISIMAMIALLRFMRNFGILRKYIQRQKDLIEGPVHPLRLSPDLKKEYTFTLISSKAHRARPDQGHEDHAVVDRGPKAQGAEQQHKVSYPRWEVTMRILSPKLIFSALILLAMPLWAEERTGILLTDDNLKVTETQKEIKKDQDDVMKMLIAGNKRHSKHMVHGIVPRIMVVSCSDAHVPPDAVFNTKPGELYTNRAWGNIVDQALLGSLEYGAEQLNCRVLVVMGHSDCTALREAIAEYNHPRTEWRSLNQQALYQRLEPGVAEMIKAQDETEAQAGKRLEGQDLIDAVVKNNVLNTIHDIREQSPVLWRLEQDDVLKIVGCIYHKDTGIVEWIKQ